MSRQTTSPLKALLNVEASASVPKLSNAQMLDASENSAIRDIWVLPPDNPKLHAGRKVAVVATADGVEEVELTTILHYFRSRGAQVDLIAPKNPATRISLASRFPPSVKRTS
jgi:protease I